MLEGNSNSVNSTRQSAEDLDSSTTSLTNRGDDGVLEGVTIGNEDANDETSSDSEIESGVVIHAGRITPFRKTSHYKSFGSKSYQRHQLSRDTSNTSASKAVVSLQDKAVSEGLKKLRFNRHVSAFDIDLNALEEHPWRNKNVDVLDYFNYGFNEKTWMQYCEKQLILRAKLGLGPPSSNSSIINKTDTSTSSTTLLNAATQEPTIISNIASTLPPIPPQSNAVKSTGSEVDTSKIAQHVTAKEPVVTVEDRRPPIPKVPMPTSAETHATVMPTFPAATIAAAPVTLPSNVISSNGAVPVVPSLPPPLPPNPPPIGQVSVENPPTNNLMMMQHPVFAAAPQMFPFPPQGHFPPRGPQHQMAPDMFMPGMDARPGMPWNMAGGQFMTGPNHLNMAGDGRNNGGRMDGFGGFDNKGPGSFQGPNHFRSNVPNGRHFGVDSRRDRDLESFRERDRYEEAGSRDWRDREKERDRDRDRDRDREREKDKDKDRDGVKEREKNREKEKDRDRERDRRRETDKGSRGEEDDKHKRKAAAPSTKESSSKDSKDKHKKDRDDDRSVRKRKSRSRSMSGSPSPKKKGSSSSSRREK